MTITATTELKPWWRERGEIWGVVLSDTLGFWSAGDEGCFAIHALEDMGDHFVAKTAGLTVLKFLKVNQVARRPGT